MPDSCKYIDLDYIYTDPETGILRNLADISDADVLLFFESGAVTKRIQELYENPDGTIGAGTWENLTIAVLLQPEIIMTD